MIMFGRNVPVKKRVPFNLERKVAAHKTSEAWETVPHAGIIIELDVTTLLTFIESLKQSPDFKDLRPTINLVMLKIIAEGLKKSPELNAYIKYSKDSNAGEIILLEDVNIAVVTYLADGRTITPVLMQVDKKSLKELCKDMEYLQQRIKNTNIDYLLFEAAWMDTMENMRQGHLCRVINRAVHNFFGKNKVIPPRKALKEYETIPPEDRITAKDLLSATVLVSNIGPVFKGLRCSIGLLQVIPPQVAVFGVASVRRAPVVIRDEMGEEVVAIRDILPVSIYADHRGIDFGPAVDMIRRILELCEHPDELLSL